MHEDCCLLVVELDIAVQSVTASTNQSPAASVRKPGLVENSDQWIREKPPKSSSEQQWEAAGIVQPLGKQAPGDACVSSASTD